MFRRCTHVASGRQHEANFLEYTTRCTPFARMIYAPIKTSCWKVSTDKDVDNGKFWHSIFMILLVHWHPRMKWTVPQYGRTERTVRVTENNTVNVTHIYGRWKCRSSRNYCKDIVSPHSCLLCFYVNLRCCTTSFMDSLLGGMDLRPRERAAERPVRHMFRSRGFPRESRLK